MVRKSEGFKVGDLVVYIEVDSICPETPEFEFLRERKFRVRTIKLRKQISQGLIQPLSILPEGKKYKEDDDLTEILKIVKYDPELQQEMKDTVPKGANNPINRFFFKYSWYRKLYFTIFPKDKKGWPQFLPHTDETRIQSLPWLPKAICDAGMKCYITEKLDGQSATYFTRTALSMGYIEKVRFGVCSRKMYLRTKHQCSWWDIAESCQIERRLREARKFYKSDIAIQGEIIGPGIQKNKYLRKDYDFYVFNVMDYKIKRHFQYSEIVDFCNKFGFKMVPVIVANTEISSEVPELVKYSIGNSILYPKISREGIVVRIMEDFPCKVNSWGQVSFKVINPEFLLKYQDEVEE